MDYDKIDTVERDEDSANNLITNDEIQSTKASDTLETQSRQTSKEQYHGRHFNILETFEQIFEHQLIGDIYSTISNAFKIQLANYQKTEVQLQQEKEENDKRILQQENINLESSNFREEFHIKIQNLLRDLAQKERDL